MARRYKIGWFSTGRGEGSRGLLRTVQEAIKTGQLDVDIEFVYCSRDRGETDATDGYLDMVEGYGIPLVSFSYQMYKAVRGMPNPDPLKPLPLWRLDYDREVMKRLKGFHPDLCVLAGFMLITGPEMCRRYDIINLHPAAPDGPVGTWQQVIWKLVEEEASTQGVKMHVAIPELDAGPTATYCLFSIRGKPFDRLWAEIRGKSVAEIKTDEGENNPLFKAIRRHGYVRELPLVVATIKSFSRGRVKITPDKKVADAAGRLINGYDLTAEIDEAVRNNLG
ncbi:MAG TPA: formyltransferase family protein [Dehalococcoidales bacterium]|nr:formyltransferase family protein [Dehalococcoidales bacterium]